MTGTRLGLISFGGPLAAIGIIQKEVVVRKRWMDADWFTSAVAFTNLFPGPTATEMVIYTGYTRAGVRGGLVLGLSYVYPAFLIMLALSWAYFRFGLVPAVEGVVYGLTPAAVGVLVWAALQMARAGVKTALEVALLLTSFVLVAYADWPVAFVILAGGAAGYAASLKPRLAAVEPTLAVLFLNMVKAGALCFGGGYVIVPFLSQDFVERLHWLSPQEFLVAFALGKATPGPLSISATFIGYKAAGVLGALVATIAVFLPGFVIMLAAAPYFERLRAWHGARPLLGGLKAAAVGAILAASAELIGEAMPDWNSVGILLGSAAACFWLETTWVFAGAGAIGLALFYGGLT